MVGCLWTATASANGLLLLDLCQIVTVVRAVQK